MPSDNQNRAANERLAQHGRELAHEIDERSPEGRRAERILRSQCRVPDAGKHAEAFREVMSELRSFATGGGATASASGGGAAAFVSPYFMWDDWAPFRGIARAFADQCEVLPLPAYGLQMYVPAFTSTTSTTQQTEGQAVSELDPSTALLASGAVQTVAGQVTVTLQAYDRAFSGGGTFDKLMGRQLQQQLDAQVDLYAITQALGAGPVVGGQSTFSIGGLYQDLAAAREVLTDTTGTRLRPTHMFTTSDLYSYVTRQLDSSLRPIVTPQFAPGFPIAVGADANDESNDIPVWSRFTGTVMPGGVLWFTDENIPTFGTTSESQIIVGAPHDSVILMEDEPVLQVFPESSVAGSLEVTLILREYVAAVVRHTSGVAVIAGIAYQSSLK
jgi:hypothetical protein